ncbi:hypothetical protein T492DRAFT_905536, partial [Pavlovales sp. CCMP2436]
MKRKNKIGCYLPRTRKVRVFFFIFLFTFYLPHTQRFRALFYSYYLPQPVILKKK